MPLSSPHGACCAPTEPPASAVPLHPSRPAPPDWAPAGEPASRVTSLPHGAWGSEHSASSDTTCVDGLVMTFITLTGLFFHRLCSLNSCGFFGPAGV